jgi:adenine-specific DNA methylase
MDSKLRGGYYTPSTIADFLAHWAIRTQDSKVLEPSAGDGAFVDAALRRLTSGYLQAVELFEDEARKIRERASGNLRVACGDVFEWYDASLDGTFDAVIGNPPFIRYQNFPEKHRAAGFKWMHSEGLHPNRLTNAWVPFVVLSTRALRPGGRLAMVLPAELLQVTYASGLRAYLARSYDRLTVVTFRKLVFEGIQQETVLVLGVRGSGASAGGISFIELDAAEDLREERVKKAERKPVDLDHAREKWTQFYLSSRELGLVREIESANAFTTLGSLADVDVGVVTGRNEFFVMTPSRARTNRLTRRCLPLVCRSAQIPGLTFRQDEWQELSDADTRCLLLQLGRTSRDALSSAALRYVEQGEQAGYHEGYKCRIRQPTWWNVPSTARPDAFMLRQIHDGPRIIANLSAATCTDTIHRVRVKNGIDAEWLAGASMNSVTFAFSEIRGRSYGGGVLELEPNEADLLPFPTPDESLELADLDLWARHKDVEQVLDEVDRLTLRASGLTTQEVSVARAIWRKLSSRRLARR